MGADFAANSSDAKEDAAERADVPATRSDQSRTPNEPELATAESPAPAPAPSSTQDEEQNTKAGSLEGGGTTSETAEAGKPAASAAATTKYGVLDFPMFDPIPPSDAAEASAPAPGPAPGDAALNDLAGKELRRPVR